MKGRIIGIDYGLKRTGIAVTDPLQIIVTPLKTIPTQELLAFLNHYILNEVVVKIVIGDPSEGLPPDHPNLQAIKKLEQNLKQQWPDIQLDYQDESYTSQRAKEIILKSGVKKKKRRDKSLVDKISAVLILQAYLGHYA